MHFSRGDPLQRGIHQQCLFWGSASANRLIKTWSGVAASEDTAHAPSSDSWPRAATCCDSVLCGARARSPATSWSARFGNSVSGQRTAAVEACGSLGSLPSF